MTEFYSPQSAERLRKKRNMIIGLTAALAVCRLAACITMCCMTNTGNAARMQLYTCITAAAGGVVVIALYLNAVRTAVYKYRHEMTILKDMPAMSSSVCGTLTIETAVRQIPKSISVRRVTVNCGCRAEVLNIRAEHAPTLCKLKGSVRVTSVHGFITGYEVLP